MSKRRNKNRQATQQVAAADAAAAEADDNAEMTLESALERPEPTPEHNPRNAIIDQIAEKVDAAFEEDNKAASGMQFEDEDGKVTDAAPVTDAADGDEEGKKAADTGDEGDVADVDLSGAARTDDGTVVDDAGEAIDPNADYELEINGAVKKVKGSQIIEAGRRSLQKNDATDLRLDLAGKLLEEAKRRVDELPPKGADSRGSVDGAAGDTPTGDDDKELIDLADKIQYGTKEQAVEALKKLRASSPTITPDQVMNFVASRLPVMMSHQKEFFDAVDFAKSEYSDLLEIPAVRRLFFLEENRRRAPKERGGEADRRPWKVLYKDIGDDLRKQLKMPKATGSTPPDGKSFEDRRVEKSTGPRGVPPTASGRVDSGGPPKEPTRRDVLNQMRAARHQPTH